MSGKLQELDTVAAFEAAVAKGTVLVDFWAPWCGPCRMQTPILERLADELGGQVASCKVNVDENAEAAAAFNVMSIPTLIVFRDGKPVKQFVGLQRHVLTAGDMSFPVLFQRADIQKNSAGRGLILFYTLTDVGSFQEIEESHT